MVLTSKRGNAIIDAIIVLIILLVLSIAGVIGYRILTDLDDEIQADPDMNTNAKAVSSTMVDKFPKIFDPAFVFVVVLLWALIIVASFMVDAHPIFFVFSLILLVFVLFIGAVFSNIYTEVSQDADLGAAVDSFPMTTWLMEHLLHLILVMTISVIIVLFAKNRYEG